MPITDLLSAEVIALGQAAGNKRSLIQDLAGQAAQRLGRPAEEVRAALEAREQLGSTALGRGVALPHARLPGNDAPLLLVTRLARAIDFEARDEEPVDLVFTVLWPEADAEGFLPALSGLCRSLRNPQVLQRLRQARDPQDVVTLLRQAAPVQAPE
ncbi:PTS sugar transporter subunit IIA [Falsiroseomonas sp. HC035]|uniref:PTS sugar transporter subunit IIA n=1 Tax=Falsiroseomonas sp. HC035 TaxID=3390999 RepID=UPI003D31305C